jgi:hypothetical protein
MRLMKPTTKEKPPKIISIMEENKHPKFKKFVKKVTNMIYIDISAVHWFSQLSIRKEGKKNLRFSECEMLNLNSKYLLSQTNCE